MNKDFLPDKALTAEHSYGGPDEPTFSGITSFLRRKYSKDLTGVDIAVTGLPLDMATTGRPGARFGPRGIRAASTSIAWGEPFPWGTNPFETLSVIDYGDCGFPQGEPHSVPGRIEAHIADIVEAGAVPLSLGGDHFVTYPVLKVLAAKHGPISLIHFDAHSDTWAEDQERLDHGTMFYHAARNGLVAPSRSVQIGLRTHNNESYGFSILDAPDVHRMGTDEIITRIRKVVEGHPVYITFDIDCLDPAFAPGTGTPVPGGLSSAQALAIIRGLTGMNYVGFDVVEVAPAYDHAEITSLVGAQIAMEYICLVADAKSQKR